MDVLGSQWGGSIPHKLHLLRRGSRSLALARLQAKHGQLSKTKLGQWSKRGGEDDNGHGEGEVVAPW